MRVQPRAPRQECTGPRHSSLAQASRADNLAVLYQQLKGVLRSLEVTSEVLIVDDGSTDGTFALLERLHREDPSLRIIHTPEARIRGQPPTLATDPYCPPAA